MGEELCSEGCLPFLGGCLLLFPLFFKQNQTKSHELQSQLLTPARALALQAGHPAPGSSFRVMSELIFPLKRFTSSQEKERRFCYTGRILLSPKQHKTRLPCKHSTTEAGHRGEKPPAPPAPGPLCWEVLVLLGRMRSFCHCY